MAHGIRTGDPRGFNKGRSSKFREGFRVRQTPEEAGGHIGRNVVEITIKMKTIVQKLLMIKITVLSENYICLCPNKKKKIWLLITSQFDACSSMEF